MNTLVIIGRIVLLHSPLPVPVHHHLHSPNLLHSFVLAANELAYQQVFSNHYALLVDYVIKLSLFLLDYVLLIVLLIIIIVVLLIVEVLLWLLRLLLLVSLVVELVQDVLDLALELLVTLLHEVLQDFRHAQLFGFLSELLPGEDGVKGAIDIGTHL
jgi:hypothetical protein